jgi:hypothetical protein
LASCPDPAEVQWFNGSKKGYISVDDME